jgi:hypothetical protein
LSAYFDPLLVERRQPLVRVLRRAVERGELPEGLDVEFAADLVVGPLSTRFMWGAGVSERIVEPTVRMALWGLKRAAATPDEHAAEPRSD